MHKNDFKKRIDRSQFTDQRFLEDILGFCPILSNVEFYNSVGFFSQLIKNVSLELMVSLLKLNEDKKGAPFIS